MRFTAFDVETPNYANDRMSAIGVVILEDGKIKDRFYTLVNPQTRFDSFNISLTGITPRMVQRAPSFPEVWEQIRPLMEGSVLAAHNATFDLGVLGKCLRDYHISWKPEVEYVCTCRMGRLIYPELQNHRLDTMAAFLSIPLNHHNALSDTLACAELLRNYLQKGANPEQYLKQYNILSLYIK